MRKIFSVLTIILIAHFSFAQSISDSEFKKIRKSFDTKNQYNVALMNAASNNKIKDLALNRQNAGLVDHEFKYKVSVKGITDQNSSGRCWMYTSMNVLRPKAAKVFNMSKFEFSENYLYFFDIFEKSNLFLEGIIETRNSKYDDRKVNWLFSNVVGDGGVWNSFINLADKYGLVPSDVMPETQSSKNTREMVSLIKRKLREDAINLRQMKGTDEVLRTAKLVMLQDIYKLLAINLGVPPTEFTWRTKTKIGDITQYTKYTPKSFMKAALGEIDFSNYIMLMDDPTRPYYKLYEIEKDRNVMEGKNWKFINLPAAEIKVFALKSIKNDEAMYFSCDVGKQLNSKEGFLDINNYNYQAATGVTYGMNKKQRILSRDSGSSHGMALVGADTDENENITKWLLENSWGASSGHNGYLTMTDAWFNEYMFRVVVLKDFIDAKTLKILNQEPTMLPPWDPMFKSDK